MDTEKREKPSSLKPTDSLGIKEFGGNLDHSKPKRRISFCGRKSVREFHSEEKPKSWNDSYEISDHLNLSGNTISEATIFQNPETDFKGNYIKKESILSVSKNCLPLGNRSNVNLHENNTEILNNSKKKFNTIEKNSIHGDGNEGICCEMKPITTEDSYYGNEDFSLQMNDHVNSIKRELQMTSRGNNPVRRLTINTDEPMDISMQMNEHVKREIQVTSTGNNTVKRLTINTEEPMDISMRMNEHVKSAKRELQVNSTTAQIAQEVSSSSKNLFTGTIPKIKRNEFMCGKTTVASGLDCQHSNNSLLNIECELDIKNDENSSLRRDNYNSPLFPPIKSKKLSLRQLNDEICAGNIAVFRNKIKQCLLTDTTINTTLKKHLKNEEYINISHINNNKEILEFSEYKDMTSDDTSFLVREKAGDETMLGNVSKQSENNYKSNTQELDVPSKDFMSSVYDLLDMSLTLSNIQTIMNTSPKSVDSKSIEFTELDVTPQINNNIYQDIAQLKSNMPSLYLDSYNIESKSSYDENLLEDNDYNEFKCTPISKVGKDNKATVMRQKAVDCSDGSSDSMVLNLKEARAALNYNCKRRIEGTPHRSFLEFVHLEKEVEKDDEISVNKSIQRQNEMESRYSNINMPGLNFIGSDNPVISSPISDTFYYKRSTVNLTPNLPYPKKRATLLFKDCPMDESIYSSESKNISCESSNEDSNKIYTVPESMDKEMYELNLNVIKTYETIKRSTSVGDIALEKEVQKETQLQTEAPEVLKNKKKTNSPSWNSIPIPVQSIGKGGYSTMMDISLDSNKTAVFNKQFINLERENSPLCMSEMDDIDKTHLSLVETFISEYTGNDEENERSTNQSTKDRNCNTNGHIPVDACSVLPNKNQIIVCRQCKHCQESLSSGSMSITDESFALPPMPPSPCLGLERLEKLRNLPKLKDVHEYWRRRSLGRNDSNFSNSSGLCFDTYHEKTSDSFEEILDRNNNAFKKLEKQLIALYFGELENDTYFKNLNRIISDALPNWVFNYQMRARKIMTFVHKQFFSLSIEMVFSDDEQLGNHITIQDVYLRSGRLSSKYWKPIDHILDFNLKINLPVNLKWLLHAYNNEEHALKLLQHIDEVCANVLEDAQSLWRLVCKEEASLFSDSNRVVVRKLIREVVDDYPFVKKFEFQIEVNNIRTLTAKDIITPPLHLFSEELRFLPSGMNFLEEFLRCPCRYLK